MSLLKNGKELAKITRRINMKNKLTYLLFAVFLGIIITVMTCSGDNSSKDSMIISPAKEAEEAVEEKVEEVEIIEEAVEEKVEEVEPIEETIEEVIEEVVPVEEPLEVPAEIIEELPELEEIVE